MWDWRILVNLGDWGSGGGIGKRGRMWFGILCWSRLSELGKVVRDFGWEMI